MRLAEVAAAAIAPGCDSNRPTFIGGDIYGSDGRSLNARIGVDQFNANGIKIDPYGVPSGSHGSECCGGYSWCAKVNPILPSEGSTNKSLDRKWGMCVSAKVTEVFIEIYPKDASGHTNWAHYGEAAHYLVNR